MADSGQQQTADAEVDTLVNDIFEMLIEMDVRKIDISSERLYFNKQLQDVRNLQPPKVSAVRLRKFMSLLQKTEQNHSYALNAAAGHTHGEQPGGVYRDRGDIADARASTMRGETKAKCEAVRAFVLVYIREKLAAGGDATREVTASSLCEAYARSKHVDARTVEWVFRTKYLDFDALKRAARPTMFRCALLARAESNTRQLRRTLPWLGQRALAKSESRLIGVLQTWMPFHANPRSVNRERPW